MIFFSFFAFLSFMHFSLSKNNDPVFQPTDKANWVDPTDPINVKFRYDVEISNKLRKENEHLRRRISELEGDAGAVIPVTTSKSSCDRNSNDADRLDKEIVIFKHLLRRLIKKLPTPGIYSSEIRFSQHLLISWRQFLDEPTSDVKSLHHIADSVSDLLSNIRRQKIDQQLSDSGYFGSFCDCLRSYLPIMNFCILLPAMALLLVKILRVSRIQLGLWIFFLILCSSIVWTWIHLYKERQAEIQARILKQAKEHGGMACKPESSTSSWSALKNYVSNLIRWKPDDPCVEYFKDVMIDPIWTVTPLEAVSLALAKFFVRPLEPLADGIAQFWRAFLKDLPITVYIIVLPATGFFMAFLILALCGYKLRLFYGLINLEPSRDRFERLSTSYHSAIQETSSQTAPSVTWTSNLENSNSRSRREPTRTHIRRASSS